MNIRNRQPSKPSAAALASVGCDYTGKPPDWGRINNIVQSLPVRGILGPDWGASTAKGGRAWVAVIYHGCYIAVKMYHAGRLGSAVGGSGVAAPEKVESAAGLRLPRRNLLLGSNVWWGANEGRRREIRRPRRCGGRKIGLSLRRSA